MIKPQLTFIRFTRLYSVSHILALGFITQEAGPFVGQCVKYLFPTTALQVFPTTLTLHLC